MTEGSVLIVGAGHGGFQAALSLRQLGFKERVCLINDEAHLPYQRPPLSKAYLKGTGGPDTLMFRPANRADRRSRGCDRPHRAQAEALLGLIARLRPSRACHRCP